MQFDVLLDKIEKEEVEQYNTHEVASSFLDSYIHFKVSNYLKSYYIITRLAKEALEEKDYISLFIYQFNRKLYRGYISSLFVPQEM